MGVLNYIFDGNRMDRVNNNSSGKNSGTGAVKFVVGILLFIAIVTGIYYLYNFLYNATSSQTSVTILPGPLSMAKPSVTVNSATNAAVAQANLTGLLDGGQYSTSLWIYVNSTNGGGPNPPLVHLLDISKDNKSASATASGRGNTLVFIGLNPKNGSLIVRQSTGDATDSQIDNSVAGTSGSHYPLTSLISNYNTAGTTTYTSKDKCDILNGIEYQRWSLITVVGNGRTLDVYIDGKLARSCVYNSQFALSSSDGTGTATIGYNNTNLKGFFSNGQFYNYALTPDQVWTNYQAGPGAGFSFSSFFSNLFSTNISFQTSAALQQ